MKKGLLTGEVLDIHDHKDKKLVKLKGELDANNTTVVKEMVELCIKKGVVNIIFDFSEVRFIDSIGSLSLVKMYLGVKKQAGTIKIFGANARIRELFDLVGFSKLMPIYKSFNQAVASFKQE
jgi:anti-anti-sigma factor